MRKTRLIALLLAVAMIASLVVPGVAADPVDSGEANTSYDPTQVACPCKVCNGNVPTWQEWTGTETSGHYYLTGNVTLTSVVSLGNNKLVLNLNSNDVICGETTSSSNQKRFYIAGSSTGTLDILDATAYTDSEDNYIAGSVRGGDATSAGTNNAYDRGGNICSYGASSSAVTIHSGKITGGKAVRGGNIYMDGGNLYVYGGQLSGGTASKYGSDVMAYGADVNVYIYGGTFSGNTAKSTVHIMNANLYVFDGIIKNTSTGSAMSIVGSEAGKGANAYLYGGTIGKIDSLTRDSNMTMFGGKIGTIAAPASTWEGTVTMYNGEVTTAPTDGYLADCACACMNADGTYTVWNYDDTCTDCAYETALENYAAYITVKTGEHSNPVADDKVDSGFVCGFCGSEIEVSNAVTRICPVHGEQSYFAWEGQTTTGHYYLTDNIDLDGVITFAADEKLCIDLAGCVITTCENKQFAINRGELYIVDTLGGGGIYGNGAVSSNSGGIIRNYGDFHLYGGTIANGTVVGTGGYGGNIYNNGTFYMYAGATVTGGQCEGHGGNIGSANGTSLYIYGGTITNGTAGVYEGEASDKYENADSKPMGGNLYITATDEEGGAGDVVISNATITGGAALLGQGGNVMINNHRKNVTISNCTISGGKAVSGAHNLYTSQTAKVVVTNTTIGATAEGASADIPSFNVRTSTPTYQLQIGAGVTTYENPTKYLRECALLTDVSAGTYVTYASLVTALAQAESGDTVTMGADAEAEEVRVKSGITLDLNGKTLTADAVSSTANGAAIIDGVGNAKLVVDEMDAAAFAAANGQLPVYYDGAYTFENVTFKEKLEASETSATYKFYIDKESTKTLIDDAIRAGNDVSINVKVAWTYNGETETKIFTMDTAKLQQLVAGDNWDTKMVVLNITYDEGVVITDCAAQVVSDGVILEA